MMGDRASAAPLATEDELTFNELGKGDSVTSLPIFVDDNSISGSLSNDGEGNEKPAAVEEGGSKRLPVMPITVRFAKKQKTTNIGDLSGELFKWKQAKLELEKEKIKHSQQHKKKTATLQQQEAWRKEKMDDLNTEILSESLKAAKLQNKVALLKARKELLDQGISKDEIDSMLKLE